MPNTGVINPRFPFGTINQFEAAICFGLGHALDQRAQVFVGEEAEDVAAPITFKYFIQIVKTSVDA